MYNASVFHLWALLIFHAFFSPGTGLISNRCYTHEMKMPSSSSGDMTSSEHLRIGYASDIEGHWDYFLEYVSRSNVLDWEPLPSGLSGDNAEPNGIYNFHRLILRPNTYFIYGGDSVDKGPGDIRFTRALVDLKKRYPERVHLLVGNRDLNKLRFQTELGDFEMSLPVEEIQKPFWDRNAMAYTDFLEKMSNGRPRPIQGMNTKVNKLKWMLEHTLGCPDTFEFRRDEIGILRQIYGQYPVDCDRVGFHGTVLDEIKLDPDITVTDEQVVQSFEYEINHHMGSLRQYLKHACIAAIVGNTIFVHGAIDMLTMKYVPSLESKFELPSKIPPSMLTLNTASEEEGTIVENVYEWVDSLNNYLQHGLRDFEARPNWDIKRMSRGGEALLAIQNRPSMWGRSVVCNSYGDGGVIATSNSKTEQMRALQSSLSDSNPLLFEGTASNAFDPKPAKWLLDQGIRRIVVGHKPTGDSPSVLSAAYTGVEVVSADTSYSHRKELGILPCTFGTCRGDAISLVEIVGAEHSNWLEITGSLACGSIYSNIFPLLTGNKNDIGVNHDAGDENLGKMLPGGWWVKAATSPEQYHLCRGTGRFVEYQTRSASQIMAQLNPHT